MTTADTYAGGSISNCIKALKRNRCLITNMQKDIKIYVNALRRENTCIKAYAQNHVYRRQFLETVKARRYAL